MVPQLVVVPRSPVLKPCPFCGTVPTLGFNDGCGLWEIQCESDDCFLLVNASGTHRQDTIDAWNTRIQLKPEKENHAERTGNTHPRNAGDENPGA